MEYKLDLGDPRDRQEFLEHCIKFFVNELGYLPPGLNPNPPGGYLTVSDVAKRLQISTKTLYRLIKAQEIRCVKTGRSYRFHPDWITEFEESHTIN